jgi:membrane-associated protein
MQFFQWAFDFFVHLDVHLNDMAGTLGGWLYLVLFLIVFCETGLVVTPFLPGDSLLFAVGALAASPDSPISLTWLILLFCTAAILGDLVNYSLGYRIGAKVFQFEHSRLLNKKHLLRTQEFYERHGGKTIILARFIPIVRTFAPFVAGVGQMRYRKFAVYNVIGGVAWVLIFLLAGYSLNSVPGIKQNFHIVIAAIIVISVLPIGIEYWRARRRRPTETRVPVEVP